MSTPVVIDGHAYIHLKNQRFACIDLSTGTETWTTKPFGKYWSLVANGDKILALDETGILRLIAANPKEYTLLDEREVSKESAWGASGGVWFGRLCPKPAGAERLRLGEVN